MNTFKFNLYERHTYKISLLINVIKINTLRLIGNNDSGKSKLIWGKNKDNQEELLYYSFLTCIKHYDSGKIQMLKSLYEHKNGGT